jgi:HK97 family phage prohead protease
MRTTGTIEFKDIDASAMRVTNERKGIIEGLMSRTGNIDLQDDRVCAGCWRDTIKSAYQRKAAGDPYLVPFLWSHNWQDGLPPGGVFFLDETKAGLFGKVQLNLEITAGRELHASYVAGTVSKQSIGYRTITSDYEKIEGKTIRNLRSCELMECSGVVFPANPLAVATAVKRYWPGYRPKGNAMSTSTKDFTSNFQAEQLDDWRYGDWSGISSAIQASILELFAPGADPLAGFDANVAPQLVAALRSYISEGVSLGFSTAPASAQGVYPMMSMSDDAGGESKRGYLSSQAHARIKDSVSNIAKHTRIVQSELSALEAARHRQRANDLQGWPVYGSASSSSIFEEKEEQEDLELLLKTLATSMNVSDALREGRETLQAGMDPLTLQMRRVEAALARAVESER